MDKEKTNIAAPAGKPAPQPAKKAATKKVAAKKAVGRTASRKDKAVKAEAALQKKAASVKALLEQLIENRESLVLLTAALSEFDSSLGASGTYVLDAKSLRLLKAVIAFSGLGDDSLLDTAKAVAPTRRNLFSAKTSVTKGY